MEPHTSIYQSAAFNPQAEREPCLRALIEANANLEATDDDGDTALMIAAQDARRRSKGPSTPPVVPLPPWTTPGLRPLLPIPRAASEAPGGPSSSRQPKAVPAFKTRTE